MTISIQIPADLEQSLRRDVNDLDQAAKEALLVELYRQRKLTQAQVARALDLSRLEADAILKRHEVYYDMTAEDVTKESEELGKLRTTGGRARHGDRR